MRRIPPLPQIALAALLACVAERAPAADVGWNWELDPYYSSVGIEFPLDGRAVPDGGAMGEAEVYRQLFRESLRPRIFLLEASVYPLPAAGAWLRADHPDRYEDFAIGDFAGDELNIIEGLTAGYQEPWAVSMFVGSEMTFTREGDRKRRKNRGYMGYLLSAGKKHLRSNYLIDDDWWELEWKLKGEREFRDDKLSWSFRAGFKNHGNRDIKDVVYAGFRRDNLDFQAPLMSFLRNSSLDLLTEAARDNGNFLRQEIVFGKKFPIRRWRFALQLDLGVIFEEEEKYAGELADQQVDDFTIVFRPNIDW
ncbi:MAG: hypothetical protein ACOY33_00675 [Pseudomonadota bacterium]